MMQTNKPSNLGHDHKAPTSTTLPAGDSAEQLRATSTAKDARLSEAGLNGQRTGKASASGKRDQARRDNKSEAAAEFAPPAAASPDAPTSSDVQQPEPQHLQVQVNTDHNVKGSAALEDHIRSTVESSLGRFGHRLTRVEVHLSDDNGSKSKGDDKRCLLEARPAGLQPVVVTHVGGTIDEAVDGAVERMEELLDSTFAKLHDPKGRTSLGESATI